MGVSNMVGAWKRHRESEVGGLSDGKQSCDAESPLSFAGYYALPPLLGNLEIPTIVKNLDCHNCVDVHAHISLTLDITLLRVGLPSVDTMYSLIRRGMELNTAQCIK